MNAEKLNLRLYRLRGGQIANFLHIPKTGGSAVKNALTGHLGTANFRIHLRGHSCHLEDIPVGDKFFFFLRDPQQRFVSSFNHKKDGRGRWKHAKIKEETAALACFDTANHLAESLSSEDDKIRQAAEQGMRCIEHVNTFYADWFVSKEYFLSRSADALYIGFQESLDADFNQLKQILNLPETLALPARDSKKANKNPNQLPTQLTARAQHNLAQWYAADYDFLTFCRDQAVDINRRALATVKQ
ncbi:MAG: sulfotransferase family 2 domain-containing protein [Phormidesmis sp. RL_2_1]|nr:sulfotransferase family 2 domain-containing protein [Phormidesmis sp. RL_2_1]